MSDNPGTDNKSMSSDDLLSMSSDDLLNAIMKVAREYLDIGDDLMIADVPAAIQRTMDGLRQRLRVAEETHKNSSDAKLERIRQLEDSARFWDTRLAEKDRIIASLRNTIVGQAQMVVELRWRVDNPED